MKIDNIELERKHIGKSVAFIPTNPKTPGRLGHIHSWNNKNGWVRISFRPNGEYSKYEAIETDPNFLHFVEEI
jgi:hypothetical protein